MFAAQMAREGTSAHRCSANSANLPLTAPGTGLSKYQTGATELPIDTVNNNQQAERQQKPSHWALVARQRQFANLSRNAPNGTNAQRQGVMFLLSYSPLNATHDMTLVNSESLEPWSF